MGFKLTIGDVLEFEVKGSIRGIDAPVSFRFFLQADRISSTEFREVFGEGSEVTTREFLAERIKGWRGQRLVLDEDTGEAVGYSPEAFAALLGVVGMEGLILAAYLQALQVGETAAGRAKN